MSHLSSRDEDLAADSHKVGMRIGELRFVPMFHETVLLEPRAIQLREMKRVLRPKGINLDIH